MGLGKYSILALILGLALTATTARASEDFDDASGTEDYVGIWTCYSKYVGPIGWGTYYGWAYNYPAAYTNGLGLCRADHWRDPQNCVVTGCYIR